MTVIGIALTIAKILLAVLLILICLGLLGKIFGGIWRICNAIIKFFNERQALKDVLICLMVLCAIAVVIELL